MSDVINQIGNLGIIPVVKIQDAKDAVPMGKALVAGDLPVAEITFRTDAAEEVQPFALLIGHICRRDLASDALQVEALGSEFESSSGFKIPYFDTHGKPDGFYWVEER